MTYVYIDETIRERGEFIIGAVGLSNHDLSPIVIGQWQRMGLDPESGEYKSSDRKENNIIGFAQRDFVAKLLLRSRLALVVAPIVDRRRLGEFCTDLILQLHAEGFIANEEHACYWDENIVLRMKDRKRLVAKGVVSFPNSNSKKIGGIQVADHAAHALGGMLLEEMGLTNKRVPAGTNSGYSPDESLQLGFELWSSRRYALIGRNEYIEDISPSCEDPANPYFRVDGVGLYVAPTCSDELARHARSRFGVNYLGCIH